MTLIREHMCIEEALRAQVTSAKRQLSIMEENAGFFKTAFGGLGLFKDGLLFDEDPIKKLIMILNIPAVLLLQTLWILFAPLMHMSDLREIQLKKQEVEQDIRSLESNVDYENVPAVKTIESLWQLHGLDRYDYSSGERLDLLIKWTNILYGVETASTLNIEERVNAIAKEQRKRNKPFYDGVEGATHYSFVPPVESVIGVLSEELPTYDQVT